MIKLSQTASVQTTPAHFKPDIIPSMQSRLLSCLATSLGSESQALRELRWMRRAIDCGHRLSLSEMVQRRLTSEPLQYILGILVLRRVSDN